MYKGNFHGWIGRIKSKKIILPKNSEFYYLRTYVIYVIKVSNKLSWTTFSNKRIWINIVTQAIELNSITLKKQYNRQQKLFSTAVKFTYVWNLIMTLHLLRFYSQNPKINFKESVSYNEYQKNYYFHQLKPV